MKRRDFLVAGALGALSTVAGSVASAVTKKPANAFIKTTGVKVGSSTLVKTIFKGKPRNVWVTRTATSKYVVLDATCTHQGCLVQSREDAGVRCPCHSALFDPINGAVLEGPAMSPLAPVAFTIKTGWLCFR